MAKRKAYEVTVVNPRKTRKKSKRKTAAKKAKPNPMAKRRRRRRRSSAPAAAPRRRRRSKSNPSRARRYGKHVARRGGFLGGFGTINPMAPMSGALARIAGKIFAVWVVRRWGGEMPKDGAVSETTGNAWGFQQYLFSLLAGYVGGELVGRFASRHAGEQFYQGAFDMTATKLVWTEIVNRRDSKGDPSWPAAQEALGRGDQMRALSAAAEEGDIMDDGEGNRWLMQRGKWTAMMGVREADYLGNVREADYLGEVVDASPLGGVREADYLGHLMTRDTPIPEGKAGQYLRRGSPDPYHAAYL